MSEWISSEDYPEKEGRYLVVTAYGNPTVLDFNIKHKKWNVSDNYTDTEIKVDWWMPLPELPPRYVPNFDHLEEDVAFVTRIIDNANKGDHNETD